MGVSSNPVLLYDGVCGLCNRLVQFTLRHDHENLFHFASLQSSSGTGILARHGASVCDLSTFYLVLRYEHPDEQLLARSDAVASVLQSLGGGWRVCGMLWQWLPRLLRDALYNIVARNRYRIFGKLEACPIPDPVHSGKFLDR